VLRRLRDTVNRERPHSGDPASGKFNMKMHLPTWTSLCGSFWLNTQIYRSNS